MSIRTVEFQVSKDGISPSTAEFGGVQGEDNATQVKFALSDIAIESGNGVRVDVTDGSGGFWSSGNLEVVDNTVTLSLPYEVTKCGGIARLHLVITAYNSYKDETSIIYSFPVRLYFSSTADGGYSRNSYVKDLSGVQKAVGDIKDETVNLRTQTLNLRNEVADYANEILSYEAGSGMEIDRENKTVSTRIIASNGLQYDENGNLVLDTATPGKAGALSADDKASIDKSKLLTGEAPPTILTPGNYGQFYYDKVAKKYYFLSEVTIDSGPNFKWTPLISTLDGLDINENGRIYLKDATTSEKGALVPSDKAKLDNIEWNAQENTVETIFLNGEPAKQVGKAIYFSVSSSEEYGLMTPEQYCDLENVKNAVNGIEDLLASI